MQRLLVVAVGLALAAAACDRAALTGQTFDGHEIVGGDDIVAT